ncbi:MAG TPA: hypothetical protein VLX68_15455 [Chitinivibrionales bacterium]|nr:hypothetical protein [Chitinivibrionales bacterium]
MANGLQEYMEAEINVMLQEIGPCDNTESKFFTEQAIAWIQKNAAGFRMKWDKKNGKIVKRTKKRPAEKHDVE